MSLSDRQKSVLELVVASYIENGEPVSSKLVCSIMDTAFSSATIRNELLELCELGFLMQPHTSSGRVPTEEGYRFYVNRLLKRRRLSDNARMLIDSSLDSISKYPEKACESAGKILSDIIGLPVISGTVKDTVGVIKRIELVRLGRGTVLVVVITGSRTAGTKICHIGFEIEDEALEMLRRVINRDVVGMNVNDITANYLQSVSAEMGYYALASAPILSTVYDLALELCGPQLYINGVSKLAPYGMGFVPQLTNSLSDKRSVTTLLETIDIPIGVVFGGDTHIRGLEPFGLVVAGFHMGDKRRGRLCVVGPRRMDYESVVPAIEYFAARLDSIMKNVFRDLEE